MDCLFCKIVGGEIPSYKVYEDEKCLAFLDIKPDTNGHTLVIPKKHYQDLYDIDNDTLLHIMNIAKMLSKKYMDILNCDGITIIQNNGCVQEVKHFHIHIKPYYESNQSILDIEDIYQKIRY